MISVRSIRFFAMASALTILPATSQAQSFCGSGSSTTIGNSTYTLFQGISSGITWTNAQAQAVTCGGNLASLTTLPEMNGVVAWLSGFGTAPFTAPSSLGPWVGGNDNGTSVFTWLDGSPVVAGPSTGFFWGGGQPDSNEGPLDGVLFYPDWSTFGDYGQSCGNAAQPCAAGAVDAFLMETVVPEPATMTMLATGLAGMAAARRRRKKA